MIGLVLGGTDVMAWLMKLDCNRSCGVVGFGVVVRWVGDVTNFSARLACEQGRGGKLVAPGSLNVRMTENYKADVP